jgi:hypothetical protein
LNFSLKINKEGTPEIVNNNNKQTQLLDSFVIEIRKEKIEKINTAKFMVECIRKKRLRKTEIVDFKDGNESNIDVDNLRVISLTQQKTIVYTAIPINEEENRMNYTSISSISRALGIRGVIIKGCIDGLVEQVKSPKTQKVYRFEKT